ncbi:MAG: helix-turn-helix domain-containing protein [Patescibacteria group bacterium]|nr:helix-turn-helix domain-containing protein [Patescibacteria group bacterium]
MKSVGEILKKTRKKQGYSLLEVSEELKIHPRFLKALESGDYNVFAHTLHAKGFLKNYADFLGLNVSEVLAFWRREYKDFSEEPEICDVTKPLDQPRVVITPKKLIAFISAFFVLGFLAYVFWQYRSIAGPPRLEVVVPKQDMIVSEPQITLKGSADPAATLTINGQEVLLGDDGRFAFDYVLSDGPNTLTFTAVNEFGKEAEVTRTLIYDRPRDVTLPPPASTPSATPSAEQESTPSAIPEMDSE